MPVSDIITRQYISQPPVFSDIFNFLVYGGKKVIDPGALIEADTRLSAVLSSTDLRNGTQEVVRDILKSSVIRQDDRQCYLLLGIENQTQIDYGMPARVLLYDGMEYNHMMKLLKDGCKPWPKGTPITSSLPRDRRLKPVITAVAYFGLEPWDGALSMHDILDFPDDMTRRLVPDYPLNLIQAAFLSEEDLRKFSTDFSLVGRILGCARDKRKLCELIEKNKQIQGIDGLTAQFVDRVTGAHLPLDNTKETFDMRTAFDELKDDYKEEGRQKGIQEGRQIGRQEGRQEGRQDELSDNIFRTIRYQMKRNLSHADLVDTLIGTFEISKPEAERWIQKVNLA